MFSPSQFLPDRLLLLSAVDLARLKNCQIEGCRMFILVSRGSLLLQIGGALQEIKSGSFVDALLERLPVTLVDLSRDLVAHCLLINYEFARECLKNKRLEPEDHLMKTMHSPVMSFTPEECKVVEQGLSLLSETLANLRHCYRVELVYYYFLCFMCELGNILYKREKEEMQRYVVSKQEFLTMEFMKLVQQYAYYERNTMFYADRLCISAKHLTRIVKGVYGKTPHTAICEEILHTAIKYLDDDQLSVQQVAEQLSFADQSSFCKFFKKYMHLSPMEYRKQENGNR